MNIETCWPRMGVKLRDKGVMIAKTLYSTCFMCSAIRNTQVAFDFIRSCSAISRIFNVSRTNTLHVPCAMTEAPWTFFND